MLRRVVITGLGAVSPFGTGVEPLWRSVVAGESGIGRIQRFDASLFPCQIGAEVRDFDPLRFFDRKEARHMDRFTQYAVASAMMAIEDAKLDLSKEDPYLVGVSVGTGIGGMETLSDQFQVLHERGPDRISPFFVPMMMANIGAAQISMQLGIKGPNLTTVTACTSSAHAIGESLRFIQHGDADVMLAGGAEAAMVPIAIAGFCAMRALSTAFNDQPARASRPFDAERDGFVMGEGSAVLVLEELEHAKRRGAHIYAELVGYGLTADAYHFTAPAPNGEGGARSMANALRDAGLQPEQVDYINAHATSTGRGDAAETEAIKSVFGEHARRLAVSSTKSMTGHLMGAAGAIESLITVKAIEDGVIPPTINLEKPDPECDLDYVPNHARHRPIEVALSNSFGFGGHNASLVFKKYRA